MMKLTRLTWIPIAVLALGSLTTVAQAQDKQAKMQQEMRIKKVLAESGRDKIKDEGRKPLQVIEFVGIKPGDTVLDVTAAGGYWEPLFSAAVGPTGKVYAQNPAFFTRRKGFVEQEKAQDDKLGNVTPVHGDLPGDVAGKADVAFTGLNFHDQYNRGGDEAGQKFLKGIYDSLKPGGVLGLTDHIGVTGQDNAKLHRVPMDVVEAQLKKAGFVIEKTSNILRNPKDNHTALSRAPGALRWHTDRMLIKARKPQ
ncbi:MAG TPA: hypothetical protein VFY39_13860 [Gammaproteobacteria bacterium]|nr:hypothetical protein [Gammaproteobacteria bacterium]